MISNVLFVNQKGDVVISRTYREGAPQKVIDLFRHQVIAGKEASRSPVKIIEGYAFMFIKHGNMYAVAVSSGNAQAALAFQFLHDVVKLLKSYFGDFTEDSVRNNFVLIYELLDEVRRRFQLTSSFKCAPAAMISAWPPRCKADTIPCPACLF